MSDDATPAVLTERHDRVLVITLNRPEAMNAINGDLSSGLWAAVGELNEDPGLTAGVLTGAGKGFCSGMDLKAFSRGEDIGPMLDFVNHGAEKPLIAAIEGFALAGGLELALSCDLLVAAEGAKLGIPEVGVGLFAAGAGLFRLPSRVGYAKAMEMAVTGDPITAERAHQVGLVNEVVPADQLRERTQQLALSIAANAPLSVLASKRTVYLSAQHHLAAAYDLADEIWEPVYLSDDAQEGPTAFREKRAPQWKGC